VLICTNNSNSAFQPVHFSQLLTLASPRARREEASADLCPKEGLGNVVGFGDEALMAAEADDEVKDAAFERGVSLANRPSTHLAQEQEVGMKWKVKRRAAAAKPST